MIPVLSIPVLNRGDLLLRCIRSIDYPVGALYVINNGNDASVASVLRQVQGEGHIVIASPGRNLGVSGSWNHTMQQYPDAEYWLFVGNDIQFTPGDLEKIDICIREHPDYVTLPANQGHSLFAVTQCGLQTIGAFDENFYPAYLEDSDHMYRVKLAGASWMDVPDVHAIHGEAPTYGSHSVHASHELMARNLQTHQRNFTYYLSKWGGSPGQEKYEHPYGISSLGWKDWEIRQGHYQANRRIFDGA